MELYRNGEHMAFEIIYARHKDRVYSYLGKRLHDSLLIEDVFQNIFIKFHKSRNLYNSEHSLVKWIYTISRSELLDAIKKNKIVNVELKDELLYCEPDNDKSSIDIDSEKILTEKEKEALKLRYYSDQDFKAISEELNTSQSNVRKIISRGIKKLKSKYLGGSNA